MTLPITTTTLTAAAGNQVPNMVLASALNVAALQTLFDNAAEMYTYVQTFAAPGAIGTTNLANLSVTTAKIALLAVTAAQIADATITTGKIATGGVTSANILDGTIVTGDLADASISTNKLIDLAVSTAKIALLAIGTAQLADSAVTSAKILDGTIVNADINASAAIDGSKLANGSVTSAQILDGTIATADIANLAITAAKIALLTITAAQIANATITTTQLATGAVASINILDDTIVNADINSAAAIAWSKISKTSSSLADLATRLASDLTGTLAAAQLPALTGDITMTAGNNTTAIASGVIVDADVNGSAAIAWTKLSKSGSNLTDLATRIITDLTGILAATQFPALTGDITTTAGALATTLKNTGTSGTYKSVTTDAQGRVIAGTNPTTLAGYGITDAAPLSHVGAGGTSQHPVVSAVLEGFMSVADKTKLDGLVQTGLAGYTVPADTYITYGGRFKRGYNSTTDTLDTYET